MQHSFLLKNKGDKQLLIQEVKSTCGCAEAKPSTTEIPPGGTAHLTIAFESEKRYGPQEQRAFVRTNDPVNPTTVLTIRADVVSDYVLKPAVLAFGEIPYGHDAVRTIHISDGGTGTFDVNAVSAPHPQITVRVSDTNVLQNGRDYRIDVTVTDQMPLGFFREYLHVHTNVTEETVLKIPIVGRVKGNIELSVEEVLLGLLLPGEGATREIKITSSRSDFVVLGATGPPEIVVLKAEEIRAEAGKAYVLHTRLQPLRRGQEVSGVIQVSTNDPLQQSLCIPFSARAQS